MSTEPKRVKVTGGMFRGKVPDGAIYVGRAMPGLFQSPFANPWCVKADHELSWAQREGQSLPYAVRHHRSMNRIAGWFSTREEALRASVQMYRSHLDERPDLRAAAVEQLRGKDLACWCKVPPLGEPDICHAAVLLELCNAADEGERQ